MLVSEKPKEKGAIWLRVSSKDQDSFSQRDLIMTKAHALNIEIIKEYDITGSAYVNAHEPVIKKVIADSKRYGIKHLIVFDLSRLSRRGILHTFTILNTFGKHNIKVHSCNPSENLDEELIPALNSYLNNESSKLKSMRTKAGLKKRKAAGYKLGRPKGSKDKRPRSNVGDLERWS